MKKVVIKLCVNEMRPLSISKRIAFTVLELFMPCLVQCQRSPSKNKILAKKIAAGLAGVRSISLEEGTGEVQLVVIGEAMVDPVELTTLLRKNIGTATVSSLAPHQSS